MLFIAAIIFLVTVCVVMVVFYAASPKTVDIGHRLSRVLRPGATVGEEDSGAAGCRVSWALGQRWAKKIRLPRAGTGRKTFLSLSGNCCPRRKEKRPARAARF